jgi:hypothetical protein
MSAVTKGFWNSFLIFDFVFFGPGLAGLGLPHRLGVTPPEPRKGENGEGSVSWENYQLEVKCSIAPENRICHGCQTSATGLLRFPFRASPHRGFRAWVVRYPPGKSQRGIHRALTRGKRYIPSGGLGHMTKWDYSEDPDWGSG